MFEVGGGADPRLAVLRVFGNAAPMPIRFLTTLGGGKPRTYSVRMRAA